MEKREVFITVIIFCLLTGFISGLYVGKSRGIPFVTAQSQWSIGIYMGESPFRLSSPPNIENPVLTAKDVTDLQASFLADPFMVKVNSNWYMFFEVMNAVSNQGDIGLATSDDGLNWTYKQIVLDESFHLSYPYVFKYKNDFYMIPETYQTNSIRLYRAFDFPTRWHFEKTLLDGYDYVDPSIFRFNDKWWLFTASTSHDTLRLYYANALMGPWIEHPKSPIIEGDANIARPGGRVIVLNGQIIRYAQDDDPTYGNQLRAFKVTKLTTASYDEEEVIDNPILQASGSGWNSKGMHHIDLLQISKNKWIACVDGYRTKLLFGLRY